MTDQRVDDAPSRRTHEVAVAAPAGKVFDLLADAVSWPRLFSSFVHLERAGTAGDAERLRMWTVSGGGIDTWTARRAVHPGDLRIEIGPERPHPPVTSLVRTFTVRPVVPDRCVVVLRHDYRADGADPAAADAVARTIDGIATRELGELAAAAELECAHPELVLHLEDRVRTGGSAEDAFAFLCDADRWAERLPHVQSVSVTPGPPGAETVETVTLESRGGTLTTRVARVRLPAERALVFRHLVLPPIGRLHLVRWSVEEADGGAVLTARQSVVVDPDGAGRMLGAGTDLSVAVSFARSELSTKARLVLDAAAEFAGRPAR